MVGNLEGIQSDLRFPESVRSITVKFCIKNTLELHAVKSNLIYGDSFHGFLHVECSAVVYHSLLAGVPWDCTACPKLCRLALLLGGTVGNQASELLLHSPEPSSLEVFGQLENNRYPLNTSKQGE